MKILNSMLCVTLILNHSLAFANSSETGASQKALNLANTTEQQIDQALNAASNLDLQDQFKAEKSGRKLRIERRWTKRLLKASPRLEAKMFETIDQMDATVNKEEMKKTASENLKKMVPTLASSIAKEGGAVGYLLHAKKALSKRSRTVGEAAGHEILIVSMISGVILAVIGLACPPVSGLFVLGFGIIFLDFIALCTEPGANCQFVTINPGQF